MLMVGNNQNGSKSLSNKRQVFLRQIFRHCAPLRAPLMTTTLLSLPIFDFHQIFEPFSI